jgi:hypothetical protein
MTTISIDTTAVAARVRAALAETYDLAYVSQGDRITDEQLAYIFEHGHEPESFYDWLDESRHHYAIEALEELIPDRLEREALRRTDDWDDLIDEIKERDNSNVFRDLLRETPRVLMRYALGDVDEDLDLDQDSWNWSEEQVTSAARKIGEIVGLDFVHLPELRELVVNATYGGKLYVIWYGDVDDVVQASFDDSVQRTISWTEPYLLVLDRFNGSGHDVKIGHGETITVRWDRTRLVVDDHDFGYGWDRVCGLHKPAYACEAVLTPAPERP